MHFSEVRRLFLRSREMGDTGARKPARPNTLKLYGWALDDFFTWLENNGIHRYQDIKRSDVRDYVADLQGRSCKENTKRIILRSLRTLFKWVGRDEDCQDAELKAWGHVLPMIPRSERLKSVPSMRSLKKFREGFDLRRRSGYRDFVAMSLMLDTGVRVGEVCHLKLDHLKLEDKLMVVPEEGKTGTRIVPLTGDMVRILKVWLRQRAKFAKCDYVFVNQLGQQCRANTFDQSFRKNSNKSGTGRITPHMNRHAFCTYYLMKGGGIAKLRAITGHADLETLQGYEHLAEVGGKAIQEELEQVSPLKQARTAE